LPNCEYHFRKGKKDEEKWKHIVRLFSAVILFLLVCLVLLILVGCHFFWHYNTPIPSLSVALNFLSKEISLVLCFLLTCLIRVIALYPPYIRMAKCPAHIPSTFPATEDAFPSLLSLSFFLLPLPVSLTSPLCASKHHLLPKPSCLFWI
jgi:hypothetical protein